MPELKTLAENHLITAQFGLKYLLFAVSTNPHFYIYCASASYSAYTQLWNSIDDITDKPNFIENSLIPLH